MKYKNINFNEHFCGSLFIYKPFQVKHFSVEFWLLLAFEGLVAISEMQISLSDL